MLYSQSGSIAVAAQRYDALCNAGKTMLLCGARDQPAKLLEQSEFLEHIGEKNILPHVEAALLRATEIMEGFGGGREKMAQDYASHAPG